jgi:hypothetical protein
MKNSYAHIAESTESISASSLSFLCQLVRQLVPLASSSIEVLFRHSEPIVVFDRLDSVAFDSVAIPLRSIQVSDSHEKTIWA